MSGRGHTARAVVWLGEVQLSSSDEGVPCASIDGAFRDGVRPAVVALDGESCARHGGQLLEAGASLVVVAPGVSVRSVAKALCETFAQTAHRWRELPQTMTSARFSFRRLDQVEPLAEYLAALMPDPMRRLAGIVELCVNAIEHGNLGIGAELKGQLLRKGSLDIERQRRSSLAPWNTRTASACIEFVPGKVLLTIEDEGEGFDFSSTLAREVPLTALHGRGLQMAARSAFDGVRFEGRGNRVIVEVEVH